MAKRGCEKNPGPGPAAYPMPGLVGYRGHDSTRERQPAYTMAERTETESKSLGPGPKFCVDKFSRFGPATAPAYTMAAIINPPNSFVTPGPSQYYPEKYKDKAPAFSLLERIKPPGSFKTPAPNEYRLPSCLNGTIQYLGQKLKHEFKDCSPGPANYPATRLEVSRWRMPQYSLSHRTKIPEDRSLKPAPNAYTPLYNTHRSAPKFSFGSKHSDCEYTPFTDEDKYPPGCP